MEKVLIQNPLESLKKDFRVLHKFPQAHKKVCDENEK